MCQRCRDNQVHIHFDWPTDLCDEGTRYALADIIALVRDVLKLPERQGHADDFKLSSFGAEGLSLILGGVEQALRFDVDQITPASGKED